MPARQACRQRTWPGMLGGTGYLLLALVCACMPPAEPQPQAPATLPTAPVRVSRTQSTPADAVVLRIGERAVSATEFAHLIGRPPQRRTREPETDRRRAFLADLERTELLAIEARRRGVFEQPSVKQAGRAAMTQRMLDDLFGEHGSEIAAVTADEARGYYESHIADYSSPERVRARHILVRDRAQATALLAQLRASSQAPKLFAQLAASSSLDTATRTRAGDLGFFTLTAAAMPAMDTMTSASMRPPSIPDAVRKAAFALRAAGELSPAPVKSADGYHLVQLVARMPPSRLELAQVQRVITDQLNAERQRAALEAFSKRLHSEAHVRIDKRKLALVRPQLQ